MKSSKRFILVGVFVLALLAGIFLLAIVPANRYRDALQADSEQKMAALARLNEEGVVAPAVNVKTQSARLAIMHFESGLRPARQMNNIVEDIWRLAQENSLLTRTLKTSGGKRIGPYWAQQMDFSVTGRLSALYPFMLQFERMRSAAPVEKISLTRAGGRDGDMQIDITFSVLFQPEPIGVPDKMANISIDQR